MMKLFLNLFIFSLLLYACANDASIFELNPQQSMSIIGKGAGQDAAMNPYANEKSIAVVKNLAQSTFTVRIQTNNKIIKEVEIPSDVKKEFLLEKGDELYLDSESKGKARVTFRPFKQ